MRTTRSGAAALAFLAMAACSDGTAPEAVDETTLEADVAMVVAQSTIDDVADLALTADMGAFVLPGGPHLPPGGPRDGDLSRTHTVTFLDGSGVEMESFDPLLTATVVSVLDVTADRDGVMWEGTMARHREHELSGLEGEETTRTWNGSGTDEVSRTRFDDENGDRSYAMSGSVTISDVVVGVPRDEHPWPLSGTITRELEVTVINAPGGDRSFERTVTVVFDGTQYATLVVDGEEFVVDLADRAGERPRRRGGPGR